MISIVDPLAINMRILRIDSGWFLKKEFIELNIIILKCQSFDLCHNCVHDPLT